MTGYFAREKNPSGRRSIVMSPSLALQPDAPIKLACGQCIGCRLERSRQWAVRCMHEATLHSRNSFITLTYAPEHLPPGGSLCLRDFQLFMKRLRKHFPQKIRFFHCGEYGEERGRPHYHAILFGVDFDDKVPERSYSGEPTFSSATLSHLWPFGMNRIGSVTFESAAYVARYCTKKLTGHMAVLYTVWDFSTGEVFSEKRPEYATMSRRPGIGRGWIDKYMGDVYPKDFFHEDGRELRPPRFYDKRFEILEPYLMDCIREKRVRASELAAHDNTYDRLTVKRVVKESQIQQLHRRFESGG